MSLTVHHLNCGTMCPHGARLINGEGGLLAPACLVCHCLLVETNEGLVLIDTGLGTQDVIQHKMLSAELRLMARPKLEINETAIEQLKELGFKTEDVRHIILTHMDVDHSGGLADFPEAKVHVYADEHAAALNPKSFTEKRRYVSSHWAHEPDWHICSVQGERWNDFDCVQTIEGMEEDILLIPLAGHTQGHCGVAVNTGEGWLLHCGDAYFYHGEMEVPSRCPPGLKIFQRLMSEDEKARTYNQGRLRDLAQTHTEDIILLCSHDPKELEKLAST